MTGASGAKSIAPRSLNLLIAPIILWNTRYLEQAWVELHRQGVNVDCQCPPAAQAARIDARRLGAPICSHEPDNLSTFVSSPHV